MNLKQLLKNWRNRRAQPHSDRVARLAETQQLRDAERRAGPPHTTEPSELGPFQ
jgi:hypothetical protein